MKATVSVKKLVIPTYPEAACEELPMFAENRVHQRSSGNPYPNKVVIKTHEKTKVDRTYEAVVLENDYIELTILPEIGGRIFTAVDKTTGYDFFYRQHVIKPALIGALGSWISGGVEFNWPYHHRPSTFMPVDYEIEKCAGGITVWCSEHDPIDRMKGMVGIHLDDDKAIFETRMKLTNRTPLRHSFLWWENTAVPVNPEYEIFFPSDVDHVHFHYRRSNTTFPIATGHFNGFTFPEGGVDIRRHINTKESTSYFCAASEYDYFGGYDGGKKCGVVHFADHHTSTGKKMFTWAYNQLSQSWERALTDTDGAYAELMAGSYSNNQPDFSWLEPYETKNFVQSWYPIGALGVPTFANSSAAVSVHSGKIKIQATKKINGAKISLVSGGKTIFETVANLEPAKVFEFDAPQFDENSYTITLGDALYYEQIPRVQKPLPPLFPEVAYPSEIKTAEKEYLAGLHFMQFRNPSASPEEYFKKAVEIEPDFTPAKIALGEIYISRHEYEKAKTVLTEALRELNRYCTNPESGKVSYLLGLAYEGLSDLKQAYDAYRKSAWNEASISAAMTRAAAIDGRRGDFAKAKFCADVAVSHNAENLTARVLSAAADYKLGDRKAAVEKIDAELTRDPLNHAARFMAVVMGVMSEKDFFEKMHSSISQTCLDIAFDMIGAGYSDEAMSMLRALPKYTKDISPVVAYMTGKPEIANLSHKTFPSRGEEIKILEDAKNPTADYLLGCLHYNDRRYALAEKLWEKGSDYSSKRNLAVCLFRRGETQKALALLDEAHKLSPDSEQVVYEIAYLLNHIGADAKYAEEKIGSMIKDIENARDDVCTEMACACNRAGDFDRALEIFAKHKFIPCEGGETAVAIQYMNAYYGKGKNALKEGDDKSALEFFRAAQVLPQSLGAGLWHKCPLVPSMYEEAKIYERMGKADDARKIYEYFGSLFVDFFSNMHLPSLPLYQALADIKLGDRAGAKTLVENAVCGWRHELSRRNSGYFATTPFFIPYMDDAVSAREKYYMPLIEKGEKILSENSL